MSPVSLFLAAVLLTAAGLFYWAAQQTLHGNLIARDICSNAPIFCEHPEWVALAAIGAVIVYVMGRRKGP